MGKEEEVPNPAPIDVMLLPVAVPLFFGPKRRRISIFVWLYSIVWPIAMAVMVWTLSANEIKEESLVYIAAVFATVCVGMRIPLIAGWWYWTKGIGDDMPIKEKSDLIQLWKQRNYADYLELMIFICGSVEDAVKYKGPEVPLGWDLLCYAIEINNKGLVTAVWKCTDEETRKKYGLPLRPKTWNQRANDGEGEWEC